MSGLQRRLRFTPPAFVGGALDLVRRLDVVGELHARSRQQSVEIFDHAIRHAGVRKRGRRLDRLELLELVLEAVRRSSCGSTLLSSSSHPVAARFD